MSISGYESILVREPLFGQTEFAVKADEIAMQALWYKYREGVTWTIVGGWGCTFNIGSIAGRQICVHVNWAKINGHIVMFYSGKECDRDRIDYWVCNVLPNSVGKASIPSCDAMNFDKCKQFCKGMAEHQ